MSEVILMLEDDPDDRFITEATLSELGHTVAIQFVKNSTELFNFLGSNARPKLIILDYNSAPMNAVDVLKQLKKDEKLRSIPAVVLGDGGTEKYVTECYDAGASSYVSKPTTAESTKNKIETFFNYWLRTVETV
jgi:CheY-like chemotaxis protein